MVGIELKKCPFCGSDASLSSKHGGGQDHSHIYFVKCLNCGATSGCSVSDWEEVPMIKASELWNRRVK